MTNCLSPRNSGSTPDLTLSPSTPLTIVPEKCMLTYQLRRTVPAQYWGLSHVSASVPDGALASAISEPEPLPLMAGSGLSRSHLILATQALKLPGRPSLPGLPSVCVDQGGAVLDRVLAHGSGDSWWAVLSGRARLGKMGRQRADLLAAAADPSNYSLCATSRVQLSRSAVLRSRLNWSPPAYDASTGASRHRTPQYQQPAVDSAVVEAGSAVTAGSSGGRRAGWTGLPSLTCHLQSRVGRWAEARADLAVGQRAASCCVPGRVKEEGAAGRQRGLWSSSGTGAVTPLLVGLQAGSVATSRAPLICRCGVLQVTAAPTIQDGSIAAETAAGGDPASSGPGLQSAVYIQGTLAIQGERILWQGPKQPLHRRRPAESTTAGAGPPAMGASDVPAPTDSAVTVKSPSTPQPQKQQLSALAPASPGPFSPECKDAVPHSGARLSGDGDEEDEEGGVEGFPATSSGVGGRGGLVSSGKTLRPSRGSVVGQAGSGGAGAASVGGDGSSSGGASAAPPFGIELPSAGLVQESLMDVTQLVGRLRDDVMSGTLWVSNGGLAEQLMEVTAGTPGASSKRFALRRQTADGAGVQVPWSSFVGEPHVRIAGLAGVTARAPVVVVTHGSAAPGGGRLVYMQDLGLSHMIRRWRRSEADESGGALAAAAGAGASIPVAHGALRPFASAAASVQAGSFSGWMLDFSRLSAQLDCGLWGPADITPAGTPGSGTATAGKLQRHPAFALGDTGAWHALSLSISQQLVGPLRLAADWRYHLASSRRLALPPAPMTPAQTTVGAASAACSWLGGAAGAFAAHTVGMRPQLMEAVYALDLAVPGVRGVARLVAWYSPHRREGMVELRMF